jgi:RNA polymerase sigma-70 factor (ECF subfamily)
MTEPNGKPDGPRDDTGASSATPSSLLLRLRRPDDGDAWQRLLCLYKPTVEGWCRRAGLSREDVADVRQEVFQAVARGIADFRRDRPGDSFRAWLHAITRVRIADLRRRQRREPAGVGGSSFHERLQQEAAPEETPEAEASRERGELRQRALRLIQTDFGERTWKAFWGVAVEGRPPADVAADLGLTPGAVYSAKSRVLRRLRQEFGGLL